MKAYNEFYLRDATMAFANMADYLVNTCGMEADMAMELFAASEYAAQFERGNPGVVSGRSGIELACDVITSTGFSTTRALPQARSTRAKTPEYWAGLVLARSQWEQGRSFRRILESVPFSEIVSMYPLLHEEDITNATEEIARRVSSNGEKSRLKQLRERAKLTQEELSEATGVGLRSIQMYEQRVNDIDRAQVKTVIRLARALGCAVDDLLEHPLA